MDEDNAGLNPRQFQVDFIRGTLAYITIALQTKGDTTSDPADIYDAMLKSAAGNRNPDKTKFVDVMPTIFQKVNEFCLEAISIAESENND